MKNSYSKEERNQIERALEKMEKNINKNKNYSIRLSQAMADFLVEEGRKREMLPSEYLRYLVQREMETVSMRQTVERMEKEYGKQAHEKD